MKHLKKAPTNVTPELTSLTHPTKQNRALPKLPKHITIAKRPILHAPCASPFAGSTVQKVIYVSRRTPVISAVKRVKTFLAQIEKRALQSAGVDGTKDLTRRLGEASDKLMREREEVLVKASGRAMEQALRVAEWFRRREDEVLTRVEVRTGSVSVVDDLVEKEVEDVPEDTQMGDTSLEIAKEMAEGERERQDEQKGKRKRKRKMYSEDEVPEARLRWVNTVEVAISLRA